MNFKPGDKVIYTSDDAPHIPKGSILTLDYTVELMGNTLWCCKEHYTLLFIPDIQPLTWRTKYERV